MPPLPRACVGELNPGHRRHRGSPSLTRSTKKLELGCLLTRLWVDGEDAAKACLWVDGEDITEARASHRQRGQLVGTRSPYSAAPGT